VKDGAVLLDGDGGCCRVTVGGLVSTVNVTGELLPDSISRLPSFVVPEKDTVRVSVVLPPTGLEIASSGAAACAADRGPTTSSTSAAAIASPSLLVIFLLRIQLRSMSPSVRTRSLHRQHR
jgi:hypothetical protein